MLQRSPAPKFHLGLLFFYLKSKFVINQISYSISELSYRQNYYCGLIQILQKYKNG